MTGPAKPHIILMGLRGSGKSTLARALAGRLALDAIDLDDRTPALLGRRTVREAWAAMGESSFRAAELAALAAALAGPPAVIALGGGTPTAPGADLLLRDARRARRARIIYLRAPAEVLRARLARADNADRPPLLGPSPLDEIEAVLQQRDPLYRDLAGAILETGRLTEPQTLEALEALAGQP